MDSYLHSLNVTSWHAQGLYLYPYSAQMPSTLYLIFCWMEVDTHMLFITIYCLLISIFQKLEVWEKRAFQKWISNLKIEECHWPSLRDKTSDAWRSNSPWGYKGRELLSCIHFCLTHGLPSFLQCMGVFKISWSTYGFHYKFSHPKFCFYRNILSNN